MKAMLIIFSMMFIAFGCSSGDMVTKELGTQAQNHPAPQAQYNRAISMVEKNPDFSPNQKKRIVDLIGEYTLKGQELKTKQTQYRAVLINEVLDSKGTTKMKPSMAKDNLQKVNNESAKNLEQFINDFKAIAGEQATNHQALMFQALEVI